MAELASKRPHHCSLLDTPRLMQPAYSTFLQDLGDVILFHGLFLKVSGFYFVPLCISELCACFRNNATFC